MVSLRSNITFRNLKLNVPVGHLGKGKKRGINILNIVDVIKEGLTDHGTRFANYQTTLMVELLFHYKNLHFLIYGV